MEVSEINPFKDLEPLLLDNRLRALDINFAALGFHEAGRVLRVRVLAVGVEAVLILAEDDRLPGEAGRIAAGGLPGETFEFRIPVAGEYFVFLPVSSDAERPGARIAVAAGSERFQRPERQVVAIEFAPDFLTDPGLYDPDSGTASELEFLDSITDLVREEVVDRLRAIFADTPIQIVGPGESRPPEPFSTLRFSPERMPAGSEGVNFDLAPLAPFAPEFCQVPVLFGEVLPPGSRIDPGNQVLDDSAIVYVGSFQGRSPDCRTAVTDSVNNIVLALSHSGAHEIGHLVGLFHVPLIGIMRPTVSGSFQTELGFSRGQLLLTDAGTVVTNVIQDPQFYFGSIFDN